MSIRKLFVTIKTLISKLIEDNITAAGTELAYSLLFAFFPFMIFLMTLIGYSNLKSEDVIAGLQKILPLEVYKFISGGIKEIVLHRNLNLLSFGIITTFIAAANGVKAVIKALNKAYKEKESRGFIKLQLTAVFITLVLAFMIIFSFALLVFGEVNWYIITRFYNSADKVRRLWNIVRYSITFISMITVFVIIYYYTPDKKLKLKQVIPGAFFSTAGWIISSMLFSFYINNFTSFTKIYGSIGVVMIFMTWLFMVSFILLTGGEINAILYEKIEKKYIK